MSAYPQLQKLDGRHNGSDRFAYRVEFYSNQIRLFIQVREWCWDTWGSSCELDQAYDDNWISKKELFWCWRYDVHPSGRYLYFKTYNEASVYSLKWC